MDEQTNPPGERVPPAPPPPSAGGAPAAPTTDVPPAPDAWGSGQGAWGSAPPVPAPAPPKRRLGLLIGVVVVVAIAIVAIVALSGGSSSGLPDEFAGADRIDSGPMADFFSSFSDTFDELGMEVEFGVYGGELSPSYMIMTMSGDAVSAGGDLGDQFQQGFVSGMGAQVDMSAAIEDSVDGVDFLCVPATAAQFAAAGGRIGLCIYQDGDTVAMVMSLQDDQLNGLLANTKELYEDMR